MDDEQLDALASFFIDHAQLMNVLLLRPFPMSKLAEDYFRLRRSFGIDGYRANLTKSFIIDTMRKADTHAVVAIEADMGNFFARWTGVLERELVVLRFIRDEGLRHTAGGGSPAVKYATIVEEIRKTEPNIKVASLLRHIERLVIDDILRRRSKGRYEVTQKTAQHIASVLAELDARAGLQLGNPENEPQ